MPIKSKFKGYDLVRYNEAFKIGDYFYSEHYDNISAQGFHIQDWMQVTAKGGPTLPGQTFRDRHGVVNYTVIRKSNNNPSIGTRLALSKYFSEPLPIP